MADSFRDGGRAGRTPGARRSLAQMLLDQGMSGAPVGAWTQGANRIAQALLGAALEREATMARQVGQGAAVVRPAAPAAPARPGGTERGGDDDMARTRAMRRQALAGILLRNVLAGSSGRAPDAVQQPRADVSLPSAVSDGETGAANGPLMRAAMEPAGLPAEGPRRENAVPSPLPPPAGSMLRYYETLYGQESGNNPQARSATSSATGLGQFTTGSWAGLMRARPDLGLTVNGRTDPAQARRATQALTEQNAAVLDSHGFSPTFGNLYMTHFLGQAGGPRFLRGLAQDPGAPAAHYASPDAVRANQRIFFRRDGTPRSVAEVYALQTRRFDLAERGPAAPPAEEVWPSAPLPPPRPEGAPGRFGPPGADIDRPAIGMPPAYPPASAADALQAQRAGPAAPDGRRVGEMPADASGLPWPSALGPWPGGGRGWPSPAPSPWPPIPQAGAEGVTAPLDLDAFRRREIGEVEPLEAERRRRLYEPLDPFGLY